MATPSELGMVSSDESEASMDCRLLLTTLSGRDSEVAASTKIAQFDRFEDFEEHIVDYLAAVTDLEVFGREADFVLPGTGNYLEDRIWEVLQENSRFTILFRDCFEVFHSKEGFENCAYRDIPKAVRVPVNDAGFVPSSAFLAVPRMRHVLIEEGIQAIGAGAWQNCRHLRILKMPTTGAHRRKRISRMPLASQHYGAWVRGFWVQSLCRPLFATKSSCQWRRSQ